MGDGVRIASLDEEGKEGKDAPDEDDNYEGLDYEENQDASTHVGEHRKREGTERRAPS